MSLSQPSLTDAVRPFLLNEEHTRKRIFHLKRSLRLERVSAKSMHRLFLRVGAELHKLCARVAR